MIKRQPINPYTVLIPHTIDQQLKAVYAKLDREERAKQDHKLNKENEHGMERFKLHGR